LCDQPIDLPIPRLYELLQFQCNDTYFYTRVNTEAELQEEIQVDMTDLENAEKLLHVVLVSNVFLGLLERCLERLVI
jgi:hypothetical protein